MSERKQIGVTLIATNKYKLFVQPLLNSIQKNFLKKHDVKIFLFTDEPAKYNYNGDILQVKIESYKFPYATLYRYKIITENALLFDQLDYIYYMDVDMDIVADVGEEVFSSFLLSVKHPGYFHGGWGSPNYPNGTTSYLPPEQRKTYYAGGFQGGNANEYLKCAKNLSERITEDERRGIVAEWHDETHWNTYLNSGQTPFVSLPPTHCMVEQKNLRKLWKIDKMEPKIIALAKNHIELRK